MIWQLWVAFAAVVVAVVAYVVFERSFPTEPFTKALPRRNEIAAITMLGAFTVAIAFFAAAAFA